MSFSAFQGSSSPDSRPEARGFLARIQYPLIALALVVFLVLGWRGREPINIGTADENTYLSLSYAIEQGSYREIHLQTRPLHVKYPPAYPVLIMLERAVAGDDLDVIRAVNLGFIAAGILLLFLMTRQVAGVPVALATGWLLSVNPALVNVGGTVLSEAMFFGVTIAALYTSVRASPDRSGLVYWTIAIALVAFLTRTLGLALVLAVGVWILTRRRRRELVPYLLASALVVGSWMAYTHVVPDADAGDSYGMDVTAGLTRSGGDSPVASMARTVSRNAVHYGARTLPHWIGVPTIEGTSVDNAAWMVLNLLLVAAGTLVFWKYSRVLAAYLICYLGMLLAWPWLVSRLLVPIIPVVLATLLVGGERMTRRLPGWARAGALVALFLLLGFGALRVTMERDALARACDLDHPYDGPGCFDERIRSLGKASLYVKDHAAPDAVVLTAKPPGVAYASGHVTVTAGAIRNLPAEHRMEWLRTKGVGYIVVSNITSGTVDLLGKPLLPLCRELTVEASFPPDVFVLSTRLPTGPNRDACAVLGRLVSVGGDSQ